MIFGIHVPACQVKTMCRVQEWLLRLDKRLRYLPWMSFKGESLPAQ